jgi:hypothetical protein
MIRLIIAASLLAGCTSIHVASPVTGSNIVVVTGVGNRAPNEVGKPEQPEQPEPKA